MGLRHLPADESEQVQNEMIRIAQRSRFKRSAFLSIVAILFILVLMFFSWRDGNLRGLNAAKEQIDQLNTKVQSQEKTIKAQAREIKELKDKPAVVTPVSPTIDLQTLHTKIEDISELATVEYLFTDSAKFSDSLHLLNLSVPLTEKSFILKWDGTIKAGVDLKKVQLRLREPASDNENAPKEIIVTLPSAKILSYEIDNDSVEILSETGNIFNPITVNDKVAFDAAAKKSMEDRVIENGLLEKAQKNAQDILTQLILFDSEIEKNYTVKFVVTTK